MIFAATRVEVHIWISLTLALAAVSFLSCLTLEKYEIMDPRIGKFYPFGYPEFT